MRRKLGTPLLRFTTRHLVDWLPTKSLLAHYDPAITPSCPFCHCRETTQHVWMCPSREGWRQQFHSRLRDHLATTHTSPAIVSPLMAAVAAHFSNTPPTGDIDVPALLKGLLPRTWTTLQSDYHHEGTTRYHRIPDGPTWSRKLITFLWSITHAGWRQRCEEAASLDVTTQHELAKSSITSLYSKAACLPISRLSEVLPEPQTAILNRTLENQQSWLAVTTPAVDAAVYRHQHFQRTRTRPITHYFPYTNSHGPESVATQVAARHAGYSGS